MDLDLLREYCLSKAGTTEELPFGPDTLVFKVMGKMFALTDVDRFTSINLKCEPEKAIELREQYPGVKAGYHMNKKHWNTITSVSDVPIDLHFELIDLSYDLVVKGLKRKDRDLLEQLKNTT